MLAVDLAVAAATTTPTNVPRDVRIDVNRDGHLSPIDALQVINVLNGSTRFEDNPTPTQFRILQSRDRPL